MISINDNFLRLKDNYLFAKINQKVNQYLKENENADIIRLGIGDVTRPMPKAITNAIKKRQKNLKTKKLLEDMDQSKGTIF